MATIRAFTTIEQSRKLTEILPIESADMFYDGVQDLYKEKVYNIPINGSSITVRNGHIITKEGIKANLLLPCWSLAALLSVLPNYQLQTQDDGIGIICSCNGNFGIVTADNPVDACVEMILKLNKIKML